MLQIAVIVASAQQLKGVFGRTVATCTLVPRVRDEGDGLAFLNGGALRKCWSRACSFALCFHVPVSREDVIPVAGVPVRHVRPRSPLDLNECVQVLAEVHEHDAYPVNWPDSPAGWLTQASLLAAWVAELDGRIVGHVGLSRSGAGDAAPALWSSREGVSIEGTAVVSRLFVAPAARGHGIGALLMAEVAREARARDLHPVLDVVASDTSAAALYERLGWALLATVEQQWSPDQTVVVRCYAAAG